MSTAERYVMAAYSVFLVAVLAYLVLHSLRVARLERELAELTDLARGRDVERDEVAVPGGVGG